MVRFTYARRAYMSVRNLLSDRVCLDFFGRGVEEGVGEGGQGICFPTSFSDGGYEQFVIFLR